MSPKGYPTLEELTKPPPPANPDEVASIARQGIVGQCLQGALNDIVAEEDAADDAADRDKAESAENDDEAGETPAAEKTVLRLRKHMADNVMKEFGRAVARTKWGSKDPNKGPPAALVRGRLDHYNRLQGKWRIIVRDAKFKRRAALETNRKKVRPPPLWEVTKNRESTDSISMQILAYDDMV